MTQAEFEERTGLTVTSEEFNYIHEAYLSVPYDKDVFCSGIKTNEAKTLVAMLGRHLQEERTINRAIRDQRDQLVNYIFDQSVNPDTEELRDKARELLGRDEYLARLIEAGETLDDEDAKYIAAKLRQR